MAATHILAVGKIVAGDVHMQVSPPDGWLQDLIDYGAAYDELPEYDAELEWQLSLLEEAAATDDYEDWMEDVEWMRRGC